MNKSYYAIIPANVRYDKELNPNAKLLYGEITALTNEKGYCWASNEYFSELYEVSKKSVSRWISQLNEKGYVVVKLIYKENSKQVANRHIYINDRPMDKNVQPYGQKCLYPIEKNVQDNITVLNNTSNINTLCIDVIDYLNKKTNKKYKHNTDKTKKSIHARAKEGFTLDDFKKVIDIKCKDWLHTANMEQYLRPETLFGTKFEGYLNQNNDVQERSQYREYTPNFNY